MASKFKNFFDRHFDTSLFMFVQKLEFAKGEETVRHNLKTIIYFAFQIIS